MYEYRIRRQVELADTDMSGIAHFSRFFVFMENAEHELLNALGISPFSQYEGRTIGWPRVATSCVYLSPARFQDVLDIHLRVRRKGTKSLTFACEITRDGTPIARGETTAVCCILGSAGIESIPIPGFIADRLEEAPG
jgi:acyl-CoA thioester hydrolase